MKLSFSLLAALAVHSVYAAPSASTKTSHPVSSKALTATSTPTVTLSPNVNGMSPCAIVSTKAKVALAADPECIYFHRPRFVAKLQQLAQ